MLTGRVVYVAVPVQRSLSPDRHRGIGAHLSDERVGVLTVRRRSAALEVQLSQTRTLPLYYWQAALRCLPKARQHIATIW